MGIDGRNTIFIRGSKDILDCLEATGLALETSDPELREISDAFFGSKNIKVLHRAPKYLVADYYFRNEPVYQYLTELLKENPTCWIKNTYSTDAGNCGLWIGRMGPDGVPSVQDLEWGELCEEEIAFETDFSC
jgi:hypothetical protein